VFQQQVITGVGIDWILEMNATHSQEFNAPEAREWRQLYRYRHPTEVCVLKCMDGRLHVPVMTQTPLGIIQPFRNLGGKFNLGWHFLQELVIDTRKYARRHKRHLLWVITKHKSKGSKKRGCRGFHYDDEAAKESAFRLKAQFDSVFEGDPKVASVVWCIETDCQSIIMYDEEGREVNLADVDDDSPEGVYLLLLKTYPSLQDTIRRDMVPLVAGNIRHSRKIQRADEPLGDAEHKESILGVGRGFDFLHVINTALIVGPYSPDLSMPIREAAGLIQDNFDAGRLSGKKPILMVCAPYRRNGYQRRLAHEKAKFLGEYVQQVIHASHEELEGMMSVLIACTDLRSREIEVLERIDR
jgi:hypothetical protein